MNTVTYERPEVGYDDQKVCFKLATEIITRKSKPEQIVIVAKLLTENMRLIAETNEHRQMLGLEPLPTFDAPKH